MSQQCSVTELIEASYALERSGDIGAAFQRARQAVDQVRASGEPEILASALDCLAYVLFRVGSYEEVQLLAEEALATAPADTRPRAEALLLLGMCGSQRADLSVAEEYFHRAAELSRKLGYALALIRALHNLSAAVYRERGQFGLALAADEETLALLRERGWSTLTYGPLSNIALIYSIIGQRERTYDTLDELARVAQPGSPAEGYIYYIRGNLALEEGKYELASALYSQARTIGETVGDPPLNVLVRLGQSRYHRTRGNMTTARDWAEDALTVSTRVRSEHLRGMALIERGRALWLLGDLGAAENDLRSAVQVLLSCQSLFDLARARFVLAALLQQQQHPQATSLWRDAARSILEGDYAFLLEQERTLAFPLVAAHLNHVDPDIATLSNALVAHLERVPPPSLRVITFGGFEVWQGAQPIDRSLLRRRRAGELFALLLFSPGRTLSFDQIAEALWPDKEPDAVQTAFHHATAALRHALEPDLPDKFSSRYLKVEEGRVSLYLPPGSSIDFQLFETLCRKSEWEAALAVCTGELLPQCLYADWLVVPRQELGQLRLQALLGLAECKLAAGFFQEALEACSRALELEPWQEQAVLLGMRACLVLNDRARARRLYRDLEKKLREDLNTEPQAELQTLYQMLTPSARPKLRP